MPRPRPRSRRRRPWTRRVARVRPRRLWTRRLGPVRRRRLWTRRAGRARRRRMWSSRSGQARRPMARPSGLGRRPTWPRAGVAGRVGGGVVGVAEGPRPRSTPSPSPPGPRRPHPTRPGRRPTRRPRRTPRRPPPGGRPPERGWRTTRSPTATPPRAATPWPCPRRVRPGPGRAGDGGRPPRSAPVGRAPTRWSTSRPPRRPRGERAPTAKLPASQPPVTTTSRPAGGAGTASERGSGRTRRRGRGRPAAAKDDTATAAAPEADAPRAGAAAPARPAATERSTRLETRGRGGRPADRGRRRPRGLTEEQKRVLREEGPDKRMLVTEGAERTQIGVLEGQTLVEHYVTRKAGRSMVGNIYLGRVQNVLPGMEAAFIDIGRGRNAVLYAGEVNYSEEDLDGEAPRIEKVLKAGQPVLVQVTKDPIGAKGARLTAQVSLAGRYLVLQPEDNTFGISRRLPEEERSRLRDILKEVRPKGLGLIVRTAAEGASADDLRADLARLQARWEGVERKAKKASAPAAIYSEPELVVRVIRDIFSPDFAELVVDDDELYQRVHEYLQGVAPDLLPKPRRHDGALPLFEDYRVVEQIHKALERKVWLPSGGSIVIDRTEAMTVVDVNTGKFVGRANLEETVVANNLEAADEVVRQLRLRDIGGIIIIDFIDMLFERNQQAVVDRLRDALTRDKTKSQVMEVSSLGLVQMTRKRVSGGLLDSFSETCPTCDGRGVVITHEIQ